MQRFPGLSSEAEPLLDAEKELLDRLSKEYRDLLPVLSALDVADGLYLQRVDEVRDYIAEQLFWIRSAAPVTVSSFGEIPSGMAWLFDADHWREFARNLFLLMTRFPARCLVLLIAVVTLCITRPWIIAALTRVGQGTRRISTVDMLTWQVWVDVVIGVADSSGSVFSGLGNTAGGRSQCMVAWDGVRFEQCNLGCFGFGICWSGKPAGWAGNRAF